jgi:hypothetical protein
MTHSPQRSKTHRLARCALSFSALFAACAAQAQSYYLLGSDSSLAMVLDAAPNTPTAGLPVQGLNPGDQLVAIDVRPQTNRLYGLGQNPKTGSAQLYILELSRTSASAVPIGSTGTLVNASGAPIPLLAAGFDMDFNPTVDRLRVVASNGLNVRINPNDGSFIDGNLGGAAGSVAGLNPDAPLNGAASGGMGTAYSNNAPNVTLTTQFTLDHVSNTLMIQQPPNAGTLISPLTVTLNGSPLDFSAEGGIDIEPGINASSSGGPVSGMAAAVLTVAGSSKLYRIDLSTGAATLRADAGQSLGGLNVIDVAVAQSVPNALALSTQGSRMHRFALSAPNAAVQAMVTGVAAGERLLGMDLRPRTGQVLALGIDASLDRGTLYRLEPQSAGTTAIATAIGTPGQISFVDSSGVPVDLTEISVGFDVNPVADRVRVVDASGLNFRINPDTGAPVDGDTTAAGVNPDMPISAPLATQIAATAYTNASTGTTATTQYTIDQLSAQLYIQNPPNSGVQTLPQTIRLNAQDFVFGGGVGFDIAPGVAVMTSNMPVTTGQGYFTSSPAPGQPMLYALELSSAQASARGMISSAGDDLDSLIVTQQPARFALAANSQAVSESAQPVTITVQRSGGGPQLLSFSTANGTALAGSDYIAAQGTLFFGANDMQASLQLQVLLDGIDEPEENFLINLRTAEGETLPLTVRILSDQIFANGFE